MEEKNIHFDRLKEILFNATNRMDVTSISENTDLFEQGILDSMGLMKFVLALEGELKFQFNYEDIQLENFRNLSKLFNMLSFKYH